MKNMFGINEHNAVAPRRGAEIIAPVSGGSAALHPRLHCAPPLAAVTMSASTI